MKHKTKEGLSITANSYCYKRGNRVVFLDRKDREIAIFDTWDEATAFARANIYLIDRVLV